MTTNLLVKCLSSLSAAQERDGETCYILRQRGENLCQVRLTKSCEEGFQMAVACGVRDGTPAVYLIPEPGHGGGVEEDEEDGEEAEERLVFYLDPSNRLQCSSGYDDDWEPEDMDGLDGPVVVHPKTQLSGVVAGGEVWIIYQNPELKVVALVRREGRWSVAGVIPAAVPPGASHVVIRDKSAPGGLHFFFPTKEGQICHTHGDMASGNWASEVVKNSLFPNGVSRFVVAPSSATTFDIYVATGDSKLVILLSSGERAKAGEIRGDQFIPRNTAEANWSLKVWFLGLFGVDLNFDGGGKKLGQEGPRFGEGC
ncbi:hypothetical protein B0I37DRAFT_365622 [Chaetomium sp. MPI-CAGE-AT-0009]|nr:hypothetical protein B0I37DRAFT_365622 [Chaetomium sp. MPI-CAGE-AT-0009]